MGSLNLKIFFFLCFGLSLTYPIKWWVLLSFILKTTPLRGGRWNGGRKVKDSRTPFLVTLKCSPIPPRAKGWAFTPDKANSNSTGTKTQICSQKSESFPQNTRLRIVRSAAFLEDLVPQRGAQAAPRRNNKAQSFCLNYLHFNTKFRDAQGVKLLNCETESAKHTETTETRNKSVLML